MVKEAHRLRHFHEKLHSRAGMRLEELMIKHSFVAKEVRNFSLQVFK